HVTAVGMTPRGSVVAEDVRDLQSWTGHVDPLRWRLVLLLRHQWRESVQRAHDLTDDAGGHMGVARCGVELGMSEQNLDHTNIDVLLEQVRGEAVSQGVRRNPIWQSSQIGGHVADAVELSRRHRVHTFGCAMRHQSRSSSDNCGDSIAWRSLPPLPWSTRSIMRLESMSQTFSATTSMARRPAP